jgi:mRNA-degrading endonuclease toxin of MazEF toxin-antitoxin module
MFTRVGYDVETYPSNYQRRTMKTVRMTITVPKVQIGALIAVLSPERMQEVDQALSFALGLDEPSFFYSA